MDNHEKDAKDTETVLMALDQISQTIDVMNSVVGRLRTHVQQQDALAAGKQDELQAEMRGNRILH
ncbi:hypothetical protein CWI75_01700 [Kineobactrum sediminis]|uniref:Uncharacterized protein n=1 Tax=Kineobactrum sediminis TaxID=1905677 RepID=A0A2N5Y6R6_9GAMM|nr:hypothetical protein [Kineobactrum sediminis]PLW84090.1 hypothetical protein CWI75_01700 [Kineobactrum sediminis]